MMNTTSQERLALGAIALLLSAGTAARMLRRDAPAPVLAGAQADSGALAALTRDVGQKTADAARRARPLAPGERIDPNTATAEELDRLPRVGAAEARRIVDWRAAHGGFRTLADLDSVPGIGRAGAARLAPYLTLPPAPETPVPAFAPAAPAVSSVDVRPSGDAGPSAAAQVVDVNTAGEAELQRLPGIGPALARRIVEYRAAHGPFASPDALAAVRGIGPATVARLRGRVATSP